jgi:hypothetical protein
MTEYQQREFGLLAHVLGRTALLVLDLITVLLHVAFWRPMSCRRSISVAT